MKMWSAEVKVKKIESKINAKIKQSTPRNDFENRSSVQFRLFSTVANRQSGNGSKNLRTTFRSRLFADWISRERDRVKFPLVPSIKSSNLKSASRFFFLINSRSFIDTQPIPSGWKRGDTRSIEQLKFPRILPRATIKLRFLSMGSHSGLNSVRFHSLDPIHDR